MRSRGTEDTNNPCDTDFVAAHTSEVTLIVNADGSGRYSSPSVRTLFGYEPEHALEAPMQWVHPHFMPRVTAACMAAVTQLADLPEFRVRAVCADGSTKWVEVSVGPWAEEEFAIGAIILLRDVTELITAKGRLAEAEEKLKLLSLAEASHDADSDVAVVPGAANHIARPGPAVDIAATLRREQERERLAALLESTIEPHIQFSAIRDDTGQIIDFAVREANDAACAYLGMSRDQLVGLPMEALPNPNPQSRTLADYARVVETGEELVIEDFPTSTVDNETRRFDIHVVKFADGVVLTTRDVTERYFLAQALAEREQDYKLLAESIGDVVRVLDLNGMQTWVSPSVTKLLGYQPEELIGTFAHSIIHPDDLARAIANAVETSTSGGIVTRPRRTRVRHKDGHWVWTETTNSFGYDSEGNVIELYAVTRDAEAQVAAEQELHRLATTDPLTGLLNRACILARLETLMAEPSSDGARAAVLFCDLDDMKSVNDNLGHAAGDAVLLAAARRVTEQLGSEALVGRFGGDEILAVVPGVRDLDDILPQAERLRQALRAPVPYPEIDRELRGSVSVGVALVEPGETVDQVISRADRAMYEAKSAGRNTVIAAT